MWILSLSSMTWPKYENSLQQVAWAETREELEALVERERVEPYKDDEFSKNFRKGGPLEMFNPPAPGEEKFYGSPFYTNYGTREERVQSAVLEAEQQFNNRQLNLHDARCSK